MPTYLERLAQASEESPRSAKPMSLSNQGLAGMCFFGHEMAPAWIYHSTKSSLKWAQCAQCSQFPYFCP